MQQRTLGPLGPVSVLTLGGGGLGQLWGETTRAECVATVRAAADAGINLFDMAPRYGDGEAEEVVGEAFGGKLPDGAMLTTKCFVGSMAAADVPAHVRAVLEASLKRLRVEAVDVFLLHSNIVPNNDPMSDSPEAPTRLTSHAVFAEQVRTTFLELVKEGKAKYWGITGIGHPDTIMQVLGEQPTPAIVQCIANPIDSAGSLTFTPGPRKPRGIMATAKANGVGVMGIRAVQAGALTDAIDRVLPADHAEVVDYNRAGGFRALAKELGMSAADLGHRYALSMQGVDTVVLGVKNREELLQCVAAAEAGPLSADVMARVEDSFS